MLWAGGACQPWSATHLGEGKLQHQTSSGLREKTPRKDPESESVRQFAAVHSLVPAIPAKPLMSACIDVCHSVGSIGGVERGGYGAWATVCPPYASAQACALERIFQRRLTAKAKQGKQHSPVISQARLV